MIAYRSSSGMGGKLAKDYSVTVLNSQTGTVKEQRVPYSYTFANNATFNSNVVIGNKVSDCIAIFENCANLNQNIKLPDSLISSRSMFARCTKLNQNIVIPPHIVTCNGMFSSCSVMNSNVQIPEGVEHCGSLFDNCPLYNFNVYIPNTVKTAPRMFAECVNLNQNIKLPSNLVNAHGMFSGCTKLNQNIELPSNLVDAHEMFYGCTKLNKAFTVKGNNSQIVNISYMFDNCKLLNSLVTFDDNVTYTASGLFENCSNFNQDVTIRARSVVNMFMNCKKYAKNVYLKLDPNTVSVYGLFGNCGTTLRKNIYFNKSFNSLNWKTVVHYLNDANGTYVEPDVTWTSMTNGFYNATYKIYCYNNYEY